MDRTPSRLWALAAFVALCFGAAGIGGIATSAALNTWYTSLVKPSWTPPRWLFGPVWSALYFTMAVAAWLVWCRREAVAVKLPLTLFFVQLGLNAAWSWLFFALRRPGLAFAEILLLWCAILATLVAFRRTAAWAGWLMVPYLLWSTFAVALNLAIWRLNA